MCTPRSGPLRDIHGVIQRREEGGRRQRWPDPASNQFPKFFHSPEHTKRFTELGREEKGEGGDRGDLVEKKESPREERAVKLVISLQSKNVS